MDPEENEDLEHDEIEDEDDAVAPDDNEDDDLGLDDFEDELAKEIEAAVEEAVAQRPLTKSEKAAANREERKRRRREREAADADSDEERAHEEFVEAQRREKRLQREVEPRLTKRTGLSGGV